MALLPSIFIGEHALSQLQEDIEATNIMVLMDTHTHTHCYPILKKWLPSHTTCIIPPGESQKNLNSCQFIWERLTEEKFDRKAAMINLGGGVIGDMGGFVASTYKRGIDFFQVPTTLLSQVDASVGGKLGIDFHGLKNHIGLFKEPKGVYIDPSFLRTLPENELRSGFAEVIKHHFIADKESWQKLKHITSLQALPFEKLIEHSIDIKQHIVNLDLWEMGPRKALNFGHTIGHAIETFHLKDEKPLLHGEAIAIGMIAETYLSQQKKGLPPQELQEISSYIGLYFPHRPISTDAYSTIYELMLNDKKNKDGQILCTLLEQIGTYSVNQSIEREEIYLSLDYYNECA